MYLRRFPEDMPAISGDPAGTELLRIFIYCKHLLLQTELLQNSGIRHSGEGRNPGNQPLSEYDK